MTKFNIDDMNKYLDAVKNLKGEKIRMGNPVTRALYEDYSIKSGRWLTIKEFEEMLDEKNRYAFMSIENQKILGNKFKD